MTRLFGIIGDPVDQVRSPQVFNALFRERGIDAVMVPLHVEASGLEAALRGLRTIGNLAGLVITVPHKPAAAALLRHGSERVRAAGAANALRPCDDGWEGDLFDGEGFAIGLERRGVDIAGRRCAVMGAGGAGAAIALALLERKAAAVSVWDIDTDKAEALALRLSEVSPQPVLVRRPDLETDIAVNATPLGMRPDDRLPIAVDTLRTDALVAEAVMKPPMTRLLIEAGRRGCAVHEGRHMLDCQVGAIWRYFGLPDPEPSVGNA